MTQKFENIFIEAIAACVPKRVVKTNVFSELLSPKEMRIFEKTTGIKERRYVDEKTTASDLGYVAAKKIIDEQKCKSDIKALIFLSQTSDYKIPFTSNILQDRLGLSNDVFCLDINAGCAGFIQGLSVAYSMANTMNGKVMLIISETLSKILSPKDRGTTMLFGDAGSAVLIGKNEKETSNSYFNFFTDGANADAIMIPDGGYRSPFTPDSLKWKEDKKGNKNKGIHLKMDGPRVFDFTLREIPNSIEQLLDTYEIKIEEIDSFLFHQSNKFIINQISSRLGVPKSKVPLNIDKFGNTSGVSIPLLIVTEKEKINRKILLSGYGSGLNWGNSIITLNNDCVIHKLLEI